MSSGMKRRRQPVYEPHGLPWHKVDGLSARQVMAMDRLANARRAGKVTDEQAADIERLIREDHVPGALKRISLAARANRADP